MAENNLAFPKIPEKNWWVIRAQFVKTLPSSVTPNYLQNLLNLTSEKSATNLLSPLKQMGIIDADNRPTSRANDWRTDKYNDVCTEIVREVYPQELKDLFMGPNMDREGCKSWFLRTAKLGAGTAAQCAATYVLLNTPIEDVEEEVKQARASQKPKKSQNSNVVNKPIANPETNVTRSDSPTKNNVDIGHGVPPVQPSIHIDLQIHISPEATAGQIDSIFASVAKHLYAK